MGALLSALGILAAGCAGPSSDSIDAVRVGAGEGAVPAGFNVWLREQCPEGRSLRITSEAGAQDTTCEAARANLLTDKAARDQLVNAYLAQTEEPAPAGPPLRERTSEAREPWSPLGLLCTVFVIAGGYLLHEQGCNKPGNEPIGGQAGCNGTVAGAWDVPLGLGCVFL